MKLEVGREAPPAPRGLADKLSRNVAINLLRVAVNALVALALPSYLTHRLPVSIYAAWVLIFQLAACVTFLDLGIQQGISKFVAEFEVKGNILKAGRYASSGLVMMSIISILGVCLTVLLAAEIPRLFHDMPAALYRDVRFSVTLVGLSSSVALVSSVFAAVFMGLQRYTIPIGIAITNRIAVAASVLIVVHLNGGLIAMGAAVAAVNVTTSILQFGAWRYFASTIRVSLTLIQWSVLKELSNYCSLLAIWTVGMLCVSGLDVTIVGHYAFEQIAFYSIATIPTSFMLVILSAGLHPLMPATSAMSVQRSPSEMGDILLRATRYSTLLLMMTGIPLIVCSIPLLSRWVGPLYAQQSSTYLRILVLANIIRSCCGPYATLVVATGRLKAATVAPVMEAVINLSSSIYLASRFGAIGVAWGTLIGSVVSVGLHFGVSMRGSRDKLAIDRLRMLWSGLMRPTIAALPAVLLIPWWWSNKQAGFNPLFVSSLCISTLVLAWFCGLNGRDRQWLRQGMEGRLRRV